MGVGVCAVLDNLNLHWSEAQTAAELCTSGSARKIFTGSRKSKMCVDIFFRRS